MHHIFIVAAATLALVGCSSTPGCATIDAQGVVTANRPKEQLRSMLQQVAERTVTAAVVKSRDGAAAPEALSNAVGTAVERHHKEWERNLVASWSTLDAGSLEQVCTSLKDGDEATYMRFAKRVGVEAQRRNEPLLKRAGEEVLSTIF